MNGMSNGWGMENGLGWGLIIVIAILVVVIGIIASFASGVLFPSKY